MTISRRKWLQIALLLAIASALFLMRPPIPAHLTKFDFQFYWGASHLLSKSENFADPALMLPLVQQATGWDQGEPLMAWNPPWLLVWLLPYALLSFDRASWLWFLTNIGLVFTSTVLLWRLFATQLQTNRRLWIGLVLAFLFLPTLTTLLVGQISTLILFGLAAFLYFETEDRPFLAGLALSLTTAKPHVLYLTLILVALDVIVRRQWRVVAGFITPVAAGTAIAFLLRPTFPSEYIATLIDSRLLQRTTVPTPVSYLADLWQQPWLRFIGLIVVIVGILWWWRKRRHGEVDLTQMVVVSLLVSLLTTPYGWSFDFILFLIPYLQLAVWAVESRIPRIQAAVMALLFIAANALVYYQRSLQVPEKSFVWFPVVLTIIYLWGWISASGKMTNLDLARRRPSTKIS